jgi:hypothetical protein
MDFEEFDLTKDEEYSMKILEQLRDYLGSRGYSVIIGASISKEDSNMQNIFVTKTDTNIGELFEASARISKKLVEMVDEQDELTEE